MKNLLLVAAASIGLFGLMQGSYAEEAAPQKEVVTQSTAERYTFDKSHTQILFFVDHLGFSKSQGEFLDYDGYFVFDRTHPEKSNVDVTIKTASVDMDSDKWDEHLKSPDFFNAEAFPDMTFKSTAIKITGEKSADITGDLTLLGVTKPVVLKVTYNKSDKHPFSGKYVSGFSATAVVKRSEFGMNYGLPGVGDDVHLRLEVEGERVEAAEAPAETPAE
tara:strand:+ start:470 stop:1126 length:657 start_codon:yes stop_codon:yes gene_type:complete